MRKFYLQKEKITKLADTVTPVSIYLNVRNKYKDAILLEGADFHIDGNSYSFICFNAIASFKVEKEKIFEEHIDGSSKCYAISRDLKVIDQLHKYVKQYTIADEEITNTDGFFGYSTYNAEKYFENIELGRKINDAYRIPDLRYCLYKYIIRVNHLKNEITLQENLWNGGESKINTIYNIINQSPINEMNSFTKEGEEAANMTDEYFKEMVKHGKRHCQLGDVFQVVLSRRFSQKFSGDDFNVYRSLRYINPSPYLFYFDYGEYKLFGSSPEVQIKVTDNKAIIHPIAGTFKRTGNNETDKKAAQQLVKDKKENAEHVMLVDLARNDLSRNCNNVQVEVFRDVQYFSHVIHLVSIVSGILKEGSNTMDVLAETFPAGTLTGAPKYRAMELIEQYEPDSRGYYAGAIGFIGLNSDINHAIMIRTFMSKNNILYYQGGAGIVHKSNEESELQEADNKLRALRTSIDLATNLQQE